MKIKVTDKDYDEVMAMPREKHTRPARQSALARAVLRAASSFEMKSVSFECDASPLRALGKDEPCLILMNHSSFTDLQITSTLFHDRQYHIVCTNDGFIGKESLMKWIGCIPTRKFMTDTVLVRDLRYAVQDLKSSIIMFPEASYSFDGTETPLPESLGKLIKMLGIPVVMIMTRGSFLRDPLYNGLRKRNVRVSAEVRILLDREDIRAADASRIDDILKDAFSYDHFRDQHQRGITVSEPFRAEGLERVLYRCPECGGEGTNVTEGDRITCTSCGTVHTLCEDGTLSSPGGETRFTYVSDWYAWERECVRNEILSGAYLIDTPVDILILRDMKSMYRVGDGTLVHDCSGFHLTGCGGRLDYSQSPRSSYSLYADYFWYEIGDMISIGDSKAQYYCFPKGEKAVPVAKARLAAEEMYKLSAKEGSI